MPPYISYMSPVYLSGPSALVWLLHIPGKRNYEEPTEYVGSVG